jgi:release factor glutamine methyltransferase
VIDVGKRTRVSSALEDVEARLRAVGSDSPRVDAEILVARVLGVSRSELALDRDRKLTRAEDDELARCVSRREAREPLAYVLGEWGFRRLTLGVDARVLVPRPETEVVVERCIARLSGMSEARVLDVGTGSGAVALAIADEHPGASVMGIDSAPGALELAGENAVRTGLAIELREWDLFTGLPEGRWDLVVSNPPYVLPEEIETLEPEVRDWEPREALVGVGATEAVARGAFDVLRPGGALVLEVAADDAARVAALLRELGYEDVTTTRDLAGRDRVVEGMRGS